MRRIKTILDQLPKVKNFTSANGNKVANQFIIRTKDGAFFQSYNSVVAYSGIDGRIILDRKTWDYSRTTARYRNEFLNLTTEETKKRIEDGLIKLADLN